MIAKADRELEKGDGDLADEGFVTVPEAAEFLSISRAKLYLIMDSGNLVYAKLGRSRRIPRRALPRYAERCLVGAGA